jgi:glycosyltransferase involved in cell wall biosynthesis
MILPRHSLVIPCYNEAGNLGPLLGATWPVLESLGAPWEAVLVDDGSSDGTGPLLDAVAARRREVRVVHFGENRGQAAALLAGLQAARGELIFTMDGDGQNDPRDYPAMLELLARSGADVVCDWRRDRHDTALRRVMSRVANAISSRVLRDGLHDNGSQMRIFRREVVAVLRPRPLLQSFLPAIAVAAGFRVVEIPVRHHPRAHGTSKYGLRQLWWRPCVEMIKLRWSLRRTRRPDDSRAG